MTQQAEASDLRKCPFCAEEVKREAILCKHCRSPLEPVPAEQQAPSVVAAPAPKPEPTPEPAAPRVTSAISAPGQARTTQTSKKKGITFWTATMLCGLVFTVLGYFEYHIASLTGVATGVGMLVSFVFLFMRGKRLRGLGGLFVYMFLTSMCGHNLSRLEPADVKAQRLKEEHEQAIAKQKEEKEEKAIKAKEAKDAKESADSTASADSTSDRIDAPLTGEDGYIGRPYCYAGISEKAYDDFTKAVVAKDKIGYAQLVMNGDVVLLPVGTPIHMLGSAGFLGCVREFRVMGGENFGNVYYTAVENCSSKKPR